MVQTTRTIKESLVARFNHFLSNTMAKLLVVFGATGNQGGSVVQTVLSDPTLSNEYKIRAVTRDVTAPKAQALKSQNVEVVTANADNPVSLLPALAGAHTVFSLTTTIYDEKLEQRELSQGKAVADAAVVAGAQYVIFSTLTHIGRVSGGKYTHGGHFDSKAEVEEYIRTLPIRSAFFAPGSFMQNFSSIMKPHPAGDGTYVLANVLAPDSAIPVIDIEETGKYVGAILAKPDELEGKVVAGATGLSTMQEIVDVMSKCSGKTVVYKELPEEVFRGFLPPNVVEYMVHMLLYIRDFGYYGADTQELVEWSAANARGTLTTLEQYFAKHPLDLE